LLTAGVWLGANLSRSETHPSAQLSPTAAPSATPNPVLPWQLAFEATPPTPQIHSQNPEQMVRQIFAHMVQGERAQALSIASTLSTQLPHFQLGQLLYADLLNISATAPLAWTESDAITPADKEKRLDALRLEFQRRVQRDETPSLQGKIPAALAYLSPQQSHVAAVDISKSRLYWFANRSDLQGNLRLQLVKETYISVGLNGSGKALEGDGKTPLGVYFILNNIPGQNLPDLYGAGALTLNYPNAVDLMRQRTGSGIWLHGTPSDQYTRAPESSDGCVVMSNPDMAQLLELPNLRMTPVLIANQLDWVPETHNDQALELIKTVVEPWMQARRQAQPDLLKPLYSQRFEREGKDLAHWWPQILRTSQTQAKDTKLELISALHWQDDGHQMVVTVKSSLLPHVKRSKRGQRTSFWRTYWQKEDAKWRIVYEGPG